MNSPRQEHNAEEFQYTNLIYRILETGTREQTRNGTTISVFGEMMRFSLRDGQVPFLTTKRLAWKTCFHELRWFLRGETDNQLLKARGVHIWDANGSREFLDSRGLNHYSPDVLGPIYGYQWRNYNAPYNPETAEPKSKEGTVDQLANIIRDLKDPAQRASRRLIMTAWNPLQLDEMALPPCHILAQFNVRDGKYLSCALYQRSGDVGLGVPFNIASYSMLTHILAVHCGLIAEEFVYFLGNAHIYEDHVGPLQEQLRRTPYLFPRIRIEKQDNIEDYDLGHIEFLREYQFWPTIAMNMVA